MVNVGVRWVISATLKHTLMIRLIKNTSFLRRVCIYGFRWFISVFCFVLVGLFTLAHAENELLSEVPILETSQFELLHTSGGVLKLSIKANEMRQYKNGNLVLAGGIEITMLEDKADQEERPTYVQADSLSYNKEQKMCTIEGNVLISKPGDQLKLVTEQLLYDMEEEVAFTEAPVTIEHKKNLLKGNGLRATKDFKEYKIKDPNGTLCMEEKSGT